MIPQTPRGFRDVLPDEAAWREAIRENVMECFASWGYMPIETPTLEVLEALEAGGGIVAKPLSLFDSDGKLLALRPDVTLPIARFVASRLGDEEGPFRFRYCEPVFREEESLRAQAREYTQLGIESIGLAGPTADAEVIALFVEALEATGLESFTVAICTVDVLHAFIECAGRDSDWNAQVLNAYHTSNLVRLDELVACEDIAPQLAKALRELPRIRGGRDAIYAARNLLCSLDAAASTASCDTLLLTWDILAAMDGISHVVVDFSVMSSFNYYTGLVIEAYAPCLGVSLGSGGRYDHMLQAYGRNLSAAGFAFSLERVMHALVEQGNRPHRRAPQVIIGGEDMPAVFAAAHLIRLEGKSVVVTEKSDVAAEALRLGIAQAYMLDKNGGNLISLSEEA